MTRTTRSSRSGAPQGRRRRAARPARASPALGPVLGVVALVGPRRGRAAPASCRCSALGVLSAGLPDPSELGELAFAQPTIVYDRDGKVELGRFEDQRRRVVDVRRDPAADPRRHDDGRGPDVLGQRRRRLRPRWSRPSPRTRPATSERGASTITQQLVRARLLPEDVVQRLRPLPAQGQGDHPVAAPDRRVSRARPARSGSSRAYLNEIFYGHEAYGIAAAAEIYFGVTDLAELTVAQAALLAGLPEGAVDARPVPLRGKDDEGPARRPAGSPTGRPARLGPPGLADGRPLDQADAGRAAAPPLAEPVVLAGERPVRIPGGQFTWQVRRQLQAILGPDADLERGGYRVITTLDWRAQRLAETWLAAAAIAPNISRKKAERMLDAARRSRRGDRRWISALRGKDLHNGALVALDYRTGDVLAYVGSAGYARDDLASKPFEPKYDAAGDGARQPGSAWKPILYAAAFEAKRLTPGSLLLDVTTEFDRGQDWAPRDADQRERGPVLVRRALQYSLNIPAIRALERVGNERVADDRRGDGHPVRGRARRPSCRPAWPGALGTVEVRPLDLTSAYGDARQRRRPRAAPDGPRDPRRRTARSSGRRPKPEGERGGLGADGVPRDRHPRGQHRPAAERHLGREAGAAQRAGRARRPAAAKTGTTNDARDLGTYGFLPLAARTGSGWPSASGWATATTPTRGAREPATSLTAAAPLWRAFVRDYTEGLAGGRVPPAEGRGRAPRSTPGRAAGPGRGRATRPRSGSSRGTQPGAAQGDRQGRPAVPRRLRRLAGRSGQGRARARRLASATSRTGCGGRARGAGRVRPIRLARRPTSGARARGAGRCIGACQRPKPPPDKKDKDGDKPKKDKGGRADGGGGTRRRRSPRPARRRRRAIDTPLTSAATSRSTCAPTSRPGSIRGMGLALGVLVVVGLVQLGIAAGNVLLLLFLSILLASALEPMIGWLRERLPLGRVGTILVVYLAFFVVMVGLAFIVVPAADQPGPEDRRRHCRRSSTQVRAWAAEPAARGAVDVHHRARRLGRGGHRAAARGATRSRTTVVEGRHGRRRGGARSCSRCSPIVFFWLVEHARLQRYILAFLPAERRARRARRLERDRDPARPVGPRPAHPDGRDGRRRRASPTPSSGCRGRCCWA